ncbi:MAG: hypothetical protein CMF49_04845 [Legionellales bacterium]|nr:hypothetical protein [Legionellales bacterium]|tara:strand:+ start:579 stop:1706 length:1128 start_codon:yes stop_codon:yes gene_type:complete
MDNPKFKSDVNAHLTCQAQTIYAEGHWKTQTIATLSNNYQRQTYPSSEQVIFDMSKVEALDTAGLWLLSKIMHYLRQSDKKIMLQGLSEKQNLILEKLLSNDTEKPAVSKKLDFITRLGVQVEAVNKLVVSFIMFLGEISFYLFGWIKNIQSIRWKAVLSNIDSAGLQASGIVALLSFLIGLVLAYQVGAQLQSYGATIYVVDLLGLSLLREFAPLLTAIIVAGRSGSAFAAQIGTMKLNEEVDALKTLGVSPVEILVLPKVLGLLIALPLLTILASCFALLGGMVMSKMMLGISLIDFLARFGDVIKLKTLLLGEIKTPVFAIMISAIGCFQGFMVTNSAASVGRRTTISVVHSIFMIIVCDALFSIIFSALGV